MARVVRVKIGSWRIRRDRKEGEHKGQKCRDLAPKADASAGGPDDRSDCRHGAVAG